MAFDAFLKLDGIDGESADAKYKGAIEILSFSWGVSNAGSHGSGSGGGAGKASFQDLHFVSGLQ
jgi:type VI secretion system secreted protein Hcp